MTTEIKRGYALIQGRAERRDFAKDYTSTLRDRTYWYAVPAEAGGAANRLAFTYGRPQMEGPLEAFLQQTADVPELKGLILEEIRGGRELCLSIIVFEQNPVLIGKTDVYKFPRLYGAFERQTKDPGNFRSDVFYAKMLPHEELTPKEVQGYQKQRIRGSVVWPDVQLPESFSVISIQR